MKRFLTTAAIALSITSAAQAANYTTMFASHYWRVTHMVSNNDGNPMCNMQSQISFSGGATGWVMIKLIKGSPFIHLSKNNWQFPPDVQVPFSVNLDNNRYEFFGVSKKAATSNHSHIITNPLKEEADSGWLNAFASSEAMTIKFRNGNEPQWSVKMTGSRDALKSFQSCVKILRERHMP